MANGVYGLSNSLSGLRAGEALALTAMTLIQARTITVSKQNNFLVL